jgi:hypothetical protein
MSFVFVSKIPFFCMQLTGTWGEIAIVFLYDSDLSQFKTMWESNARGVRLSEVHAPCGRHDGGGLAVDLGKMDFTDETIRECSANHHLGQFMTHAGYDQAKLRLSVNDTMVLALRLIMR